MQLVPFLHAISAISAIAVGLLFFRFLRHTGYRIFFFFGAGFWLMALSWGLLALLNPTDDTRPLIYLIRLCAYVVLIVGMINRGMSGRPFG